MKVLLDFMEYCKKEGMSGNTMKSYRIDISQYIKFSEEMSRDIYNIANLMAYIDSIIKKCSIMSVKRKVYSLSSFLEFSSSTGKCSDNLPIYFKGSIRDTYSFIDATKFSRSVLQNEVLEEFVDYIDVNCDINMRVAIKLIANLGLRVSEVVYLKRKHLDLENNEINIDGKYSRTINIADERLISEIKKVGSLKTEDDYIFINDRGIPISEQVLRRAIKNIGKEIGKEITPSLLRNSYLYYLKDLGLDRNNINDIAGLKYYGSSYNKIISGNGNIDNIKKLVILNICEYICETDLSCEKNKLLDLYKDMESAPEYKKMYSDIIKTINKYN